MTTGGGETVSGRLLVEEPIVIGRYVLSAELARGGMATVYVGRMHSDGGFKRVVAVKRLHAQFRTDGNFSTMFLDEARLAARIRHPNVVHAIDVALHDGEMFIVMEYVAGASLSQLMRAASRSGETIPFAIVSSVVSGLLQGLHAAHEALDEQGRPLGIVHRDVSPQNVLVGTDGVARVLDFGVAKAVGQAHVTQDGEIKGKLAYMAPEQLRGAELGRQADVFAAGTILWELLTGRRLFYGGNDGEIVHRLLELPIPPPTSLNPALNAAVDDVVLRALERDPGRRFATASEMAAALEDAIMVASPRQVGEWVRAKECDAIERRAALVAEIESDSSLRSATTTSRAALARDTLAEIEVEQSGVARRRVPPFTRWLLAALAATALVGLGFAASRVLASPHPDTVARAEANPSKPEGYALAEPTAPLPPVSAPAAAVASSVPAVPASAPLPTPRTAGKPRAPSRPTAAPAPNGSIYSRD